MPEKVKLTFDASYGSDAPPMVAVLNPEILPFALLSQITRFGLAGAADRKTPFTGRLKGDRRAFTQMIESYGLEVEIVRNPQGESAQGFEA